jgi:hypothetical protein
METHECWIAKGKVVERPKDSSGINLPDKALLFQRELVCIVNGTNATTVRWVMFAANWTSLYFARELITSFAGPFILEYFNAGWFSEHFETAAEAKLRIDLLICKSDVRFSSRTFTREFDPSNSKLPRPLQEMWSSGAVDEQRVVNCTVNLEREMTQVDHIGANSALAKVWGVSPVSYPSLSGHNYDRVVSKIYYEVVRTGRPKYDHVLAAMTKPSGEVKWFGYHRLIFAGRKTMGLMPQVSVACEVADVDIPLL